MTFHYQHPDKFLPATEYFNISANCII